MGIDTEKVAKSLDKATSQLNLRFSCSDLKSGSVDPMAQVFMMAENPESGETEYVQVGQTEMMRNDRDPVFAESVIVDYNFEETQLMSQITINIKIKNSIFLQSFDFDFAVSKTLFWFVF